MSIAVAMKQPIAGVFPPQLSEATIMTVWPSLAATAVGRALGRLYAIRVGRPPWTLGHLIALLTAPLAAGLYFGRFAATVTVGLLQLIPKIGGVFKSPTDVQRYVLTNRRVVVRTGLKPVDQRLGRARSLRRDRHRGPPGPGVVSGRRPGLSPGCDRDLSPRRRGPARHLPAHLSECPARLRRRAPGASLLACCQAPHRRPIKRCSTLSTCKIPSRHRGCCQEVLQGDRGGLVPFRA